MLTSRLAVALMLFNMLLAAALLGILMLALSRPSIRSCTTRVASKVLVFVRKYIQYILFAQCVAYAFLYNALMPESMYFSPDSVLYLQVSNVVPPFFSLFARTLLEFELGLGDSNVTLLRYVAIAIYSVGGLLIATALVRSGRSIAALFVLPVIWSMSALTMWFNYFLTDGIATAFLIACVGAYANMHVSIQHKEAQSRSSWWWLLFFVLFGMLAFSMRPAFAFVAPVMIFMMLGRSIFSWRRLGAVSVGVIVLATAQFSFTKYWHGEPQSKLGGVLTALVFDFPSYRACADDDATDLCSTQRALEPFILAARDRAGSAQQLFIYKALNNGNVYQAAIAAVRAEDADAALAEIALRKIKSNIPKYAEMVLVNSYYSIKTWGDWYKHDNLGSVALQGIDGTNANAPAVRAAARVDFDPTIENPPTDRFYKDFLFQLPRLVLSGSVVADYTPVIVGMALVFCIYPIFFSVTVSGSVLLACSVFSVAGTIFQNAVFPVIPRLLEPFQPLGALVLLFFILFVFDSVKSVSARRGGLRDVRRWRFRGRTGRSMPGLTVDAKSVPSEFVS